MISKSLIKHRFFLLCRECNSLFIYYILAIISLPVNYFLLGCNKIILKIWNLKEYEEILKSDLLIIRFKNTPRYRMIQEKIGGISYSTINVNAGMLNGKREYCIKNIYLIYLLVTLSKCKKVLLYVNMGNEAFQLFFSPKKIIYEIYDTCWGLSNFRVGRINKFIEKQNVNKAYCNICRDLRLIDILKKKHAGNIFYFPDLPSKVKYNLDKKITKEINKPIRIISLGWIGWSETSESLVRSIDLLAQNNIEVHLLSGIFNGGLNFENREYHALVKKYPKIIFIHEPKYGQELVKFVSGFDYGILPFERDAFNLPTINHIYSKMDHKYLSRAGGSRLCDFIESGIGVICSKTQRLQYRLAKNYASILIDFDENFIKSITDNNIEKKDLRKIDLKLQRLFQDKINKFLDIVIN
jgi:hypothetical protein